MPTNIFILKKNFKKVWININLISKRSPLNELLILKSKNNEF